MTAHPIPSVPDAACARAIAAGTADAAWWTHTFLDAAEPAVRICRTCPVIDQCLQIVRPDRTWFDGVAGGIVWSNGSAQQPRPPRPAAPPTPASTTRAAGAPRGRRAPSATAIFLAVAAAEEGLTADHVRRCHNAFRQGRRGDDVLFGERVYQRARKRERTSRARGDHGLIRRDDVA